MKLFVLFAAVISLTLPAVECRADDTNVVAATIGSADASKWIGKQVIVTGRVAQVTIRPSLVFLNFDKAFPSNVFTAIVRNKNTNEFEKLPSLRGKAVAVTGKIQDYNGKPEMELKSKSQLKLLSETR